MADGIQVEVFLTRPTKSFNQIVVSGHETIKAVSYNETLTIVAGPGIGLDTNDATNTITITGTLGSTIDGGEVT